MGLQSLDEYLTPEQKNILAGTPPDPVRHDSRPRLQPLDEYLAATGAPFVSAGQKAATAAQNIRDISIQQFGAATPENVIGAAKEAQNQAMSNNQELARQAYARQEDFKNKGGYNPNAPVPLEKDDREKLEGLKIGWSALDHYKDAYYNAYGTDPAFGNWANYLADTVHPDKWSQARQNFEQVRDVATNAVAAGTMNYTMGAESKASVMGMMQKVVPTAGATPQMVDQSVINLKQQALDQAISHRESLGFDRKGLDTSPLDDFINNGQKEVNLLRENYNLKYNPNPQNPGSAISPQLQVQADALIRRQSGQPQQSAVSQFSPGSPGMPNLGANPTAKPSPTPVTAPQGMGMGNPLEWLFRSPRTPGGM